MGHDRLTGRAAGLPPRVVEGVSLGILVLDTRFSRFPGDVGNALTWRFPVHYKVVRGASPDRVVNARAEGLLDAFVAAARELVDLGVDGITTTCGFLSLFQEALTAACPVPVATSSLLQVPLVQRCLPRGKRVGVLTYSKAALTPDHLAAVGVPADVPVEGVEPGGAFYRAIMDGDRSVPQAAWAADVLAAGRRLIAAHPDVGAVVAECTNMPPYSADLADALGLPVYDMVSLVEWFQAGLAPRRWPGSR